MDRKFYHIKYFCPSCFEPAVKENLVATKKANNCKFKFHGYRGQFLPEFLLELSNILNGITFQPTFNFQH